MNQDGARWCNFIYLYFLTVLYIIKSRNWQGSDLRIMAMCSYISIHETTKMSHKDNDTVSRSCATKDRLHREYITLFQNVPFHQQKRLLLYILRERNMLSMWLYWIYGRYLCNLLPTRLLFKPYITFHHRPGVPYFIIHDTTHDHKSLLRRRFILKVSEMPSLFHTLISMLNSYILKLIVFADIKEMKPF